MTTRTLPDDVLLEVLEYATILSEHNVNNWKSLTQLTAVCARWRYMGLPLLCRAAILVYDGSSETWQTNVRFIQAFGDARWVKRAVLKSNSDQVPDGLMELLGTDVVPWVSARSLRIIFELQPTSPTLNNPIDAAGLHNEDRITALAGTVVKCIPNVTKMHVVGANASSGSHAFVNAVSRAYANQFVLFEGSLSALAPTLTLSSTLTALSLDFNCSGTLLPHICPEPLRYLHMTEIPSDDIWQKFGCADLVDADIWFNDLEQLTLVYQTKGADRSPIMNSDIDVQIHLPQLRQLSVENCPADSPVLRAKTSPMLKYVHITDRSGRIEPAAMVSGQSIDTLSITTYSPQTTSESFCQATNRIFGASCKAKATSLTLGISSQLPNAEYVNWPQLRKLSVFAETPSDTVISLIKKLPNLVELVMSSIVIRGWIHGMLENASTISTSIKMVYYGDIFAPVAEETTTFLKYLLLAIPSLSEFAFSEKHLESMYKFIKANSAAHPQLLAIKYHILC